MNVEEALRKYGLPASPEHRGQIARLLVAEIEREQREIGDQELLRLLCSQLFSIGVVEDSLAIWAAKNCNFDTMCGVEVQLLCGAGLQPTKEFLAASCVPAAEAALSYLDKCEHAGDFAKFTPAVWLAHARFYYRLDG